MSEIISNPEETIEFGGLIWKRLECENSYKYEAIQPDCGRSYVYQYPDGHSKGHWHCLTYFDALIEPLHHLSVLEMQASDIKPTREEAMQFCLDAKDLFIADIKTICIALCIGDYTTGFKEGQAALAKDIREVLP